MKVMKFQFNEQQLGVLQQSLDVAVKQVGLSGLYTIVELVQVLENPLNKEEKSEFYQYDVTEKQVESFHMVFDIAIKAVGLKGASNIIAMAQAFENPLEETEENPSEE
jgi:uncharacterized membrane protein YuzA (DUF378 family)